MDQQRALAEAQRRNQEQQENLPITRHLQRLHRMQLQQQPPPEPFNNEELTDRQRERSRNLGRAVLGSEGIAPDISHIYNISRHLHHYMTGQSADLVENQIRNNDRNRENSLRAEAHTMWRDTLFDRIGAEEFGVLMNNVRDEPEYRRLYDVHLDLWEIEYVQIMNTDPNDPTLKERVAKPVCRSRIRIYLRDIRDTRFELQRQQATRHLTGGAIPRPHMFMQSEESRAISNYFHNKLRGSGNCIRRRNTRQIYVGDVLDDAPVEQVAIGRPVDLNIIITSPEARYDIARRLWFEKVNELHMNSQREDHIYLTRFHQYAIRIERNDQSYNDILEDTINTLNTIRTEIRRRDENNELQNQL